MTASRIDSPLKGRIGRRSDARFEPGCLSSCDSFHRILLMLTATHQFSFPPWGASVSPDGHPMTVSAPAYRECLCRFWLNARWDQSPFRDRKLTDEDTHPHLPNVLRPHWHRCVA